MPALSPERKQALRGIGMDKGGKLFLKLKRRLWDESMGSINLEKSKVCQEWWEHNGWAVEEGTPLVLASLVSHP